MNASRTTPDTKFMAYGTFRTGKQFELVRRVDELAHRQVASLFQRRFVVTEARHFRMATAALRLESVASESRTFAETLISYADAVVPGNYSRRSSHYLLRLRLGALRLDTVATALIPDKAEQAIAAIGGPNAVRVLVELFGVVSQFDRMLDELELCSDRFLESRLSEDTPTKAMSL